MDLHSAKDGNVQEKTDENASENAPEENKVKQKQIHSTADYEKRLLLLEDSTLAALPEYVNKILAHLEVMGSSQSQSDLLAALIYCIALESGFVSTSVVDKTDLQRYTVFWGYSFNSRNVLNLAKLPQDLRQPNIDLYRFKLTLLNHYEVDCLLSCLQTGDSFCVTLSPKNSPGKSILLSIPRYVLSVKTNKVSGRFRKLPELSYLLKNNIFSPIRNSIMDEHKELHAGLNGIPTEILHLILCRMEINDVQEFSKTCCKIRMACIEFYRIKYKPKTLPFGHDKFI